MTCRLCLGEKCINERCANGALNWYLNEAASFCQVLEQFAPDFGCHVALTGGCLYKPGPRKDCDIVIYRTGGRAEPLDRAGFLAALDKGLPGWVVVKGDDTSRVIKAEILGRSVDLLFHDDPNAGGDGNYSK